MVASTDSLSLHPTLPYPFTPLFSSPRSQNRREIRNRAKVRIRCPFLVQLACCGSHRASTTPQGLPLLSCGDEGPHETWSGKSGGIRRRERRMKGEEGVVYRKSNRRRRLNLQGSDPILPCPTRSLPAFSLLSYPQGDKEPAQAHDSDHPCSRHPAVGPAEAEARRQPPSRKLPVGR